MRRRIALLLAVAVAVLGPAGPALGDGGWGAGGSDVDPGCTSLGC
jgi:hypothetical protein